MFKGLSLSSPDWYTDYGFIYQYCDYMFNYPFGRKEVIVMNRQNH